MRYPQPGDDGGRGFTIVELMIVVVIVAILSLVALPTFSSNMKASKMTEGITGTGVIRTALRTYTSSHGGEYPVLSSCDGSGLGVLSISGSELAGKYFTASDYLVNSTATTYTIRATLPSDTTYWYELNQAGGETKSNF